MNPTVAACLLLLSIVCNFSYARILDECDLARELKSHGLAKSDLPDCKYILLCIWVLT